MNPQFWDNLEKIFTIMEKNIRYHKFVESVEYNLTADIYKCD
jgi:hypothetical protein